MIPIFKPKLKTHLYITLLNIIFTYYGLKIYIKLSLNQILNNFSLLYP